MIGSPELQPLVTSVSQTSQQKPPERTRTPGWAFGQGLASGEESLVQTRGQLIPVAGGQVQVVVDGIAVDAVVTNRMATHHQHSQANLFQGGDDVGQADS